MKKSLKSGAMLLICALLSLATVSLGAPALAQDAPAADAPAVDAPAEDTPAEDDSAIDAPDASEKPENPEKPAQVAPASPQGSAQATVALAVSAEVISQAARNGQRQAARHGRIPGGTLMLVAYFVLWVFVFGLVFFTMRRQRDLNQELDELGRRMDVVFEDME